MTSTEEKLARDAARCIAKASIRGTAGARLMTAAAAFSVEQDVGECLAPWPANDDGGKEPAA
jgi:hypothetical protein